MSNSNGTSYTAHSMNGIITIDDGAGTTIENGTITTDNLALNNIIAEHLNQECNIWESNSGTTNYSTFSSGPVNFATSTTSDINIGPSVNMISYGNLNIGTSDGLYGDIAIGSLGASGRLIFQTRITEVLSERTTDNGIVNKIYADGNISSLLSSTNIWTGSNNTFNNSLSTHLIVADDLTNNCYLWEHNSGVSNYSTSSSGTVNFATHSSGNINIGPVSGVLSGGALNIGTATGFSGHIVIGSSSATNSIIKFQTPLTEVLSQPTTANGVVNKLYADTNISNLLAGLNIWTGISNKFNNVIYASLISPLTTSGYLTMGSATSPNTLIQIQMVLL